MPILSQSEQLLDDLVIRPARPGEQVMVLDLLTEAAAWLRHRGIEQWPSRFPTASVQHQITAAEALLVTQEEDIIATSNNSALRHYYEQAGFQHVTDPPHARWPTSLYERRVGAIRSA